MGVYGSFDDSMSGVRNANDRLDLYGLSEDVDKLPTEGINSGSTAFCVDTGDVYIFLRYTKQWYKQ